MLYDPYLSRVCIRRCIRSLRANFRSFASYDKIDGSSVCTVISERLSCNDMLLLLRCAIIYVKKYMTKIEIKRLILIYHYFV